MTEVLPAQAQETTDAPRPAVVPEQPALEGLEAKWAETWKADETYAFDQYPAALARLTSGEQLGKVVLLHD